MEGVSQNSYIKQKLKTAVRSKIIDPSAPQNPKDRSAEKRTLDYWIDLAKLLERGNINALFLADTYGGYDTYEDSLDNCIRRAAQWPVTDPTIVSISRLQKRECSSLMRRNSRYLPWRQSRQTSHLA